MLAHEFDPFNGIIVDSQQLPSDLQDFKQQLVALLDLAQTQQKAVIWITIPLNKGHLVGVTTELGFQFHNCLASEVTLVHKSKPSDFAPFVATHSLGAGGFVTNPQGEILVIQERGASTYKLPGGHIELGEKVAEGVVREVFEETGIHTQFQGLLAMASTHPYRFGKSNIYMVCRLMPISQEIAIQDTAEIADAKWTTPDAFLQDDNNSMFNKYLVKAVLGKKGLAPSELDLSQFSNKKHEVWLAVE